MPDRQLRNVTPDQEGLADHVQELVEAERGLGEQGVFRTWQASDSDLPVLVSDSGGVRISRDNGTTAPTQVIVDGTAAGGGLSGTYPDPTLSAATLDGLVKVGDPAGGALTGTYPDPTLAPATIAALLPPGIIWAYGGATAPAGWLLCTGAEVSRTTYAALFAVIGTTYGSASGTTFTLPDLRGRMPMGVSGAHALGVPGGSETAVGAAHTHPGAHGHGLNSHTHSLNGHVHGFSSHVHSLSGHTHTASSHTHGSNDLGVNGTTGGPSATSQRADGTNAVASATHTHDDGSLEVTGETDLDGGYATTGPDVTNTGSGSVTNTDVPGPSDSGSASPVGTTLDGTVHAASYTASIATLPPYQAVMFIIRTGV